MTKNNVLCLLSWAIFDIFLRLNWLYCTFFSFHGTKYKLGLAQDFCTILYIHLLFCLWFLRQIVNASFWWRFFLFCLNLTKWIKSESPCCSFQSLTKASKTRFYNIHVNLIFMFGAHFIYFLHTLKQWLCFGSSTLPKQRQLATQGCAWRHQASRLPYSLLGLASVVNVMVCLSVFSVWSICALQSVTAAGHRDNYRHLASMLCHHTACLCARQHHAVLPFTQPHDSDGPMLWYFQYFFPLFLINDLKHITPSLTRGRSRVVFDDILISVIWISVTQTVTTFFFFFLGLFSEENARE